MTHQKVNHLLPCKTLLVDLVLYLHILTLNDLEHSTHNIVVVMELMNPLPLSQILKLVIKLHILQADLLELHQEIVKGLIGASSKFVRFKGIFQNNRGLP